MGAFVALAAEGETTGVASSLGTFLDTVKGGLTDFNVVNLGTVLVAGLGLTAGLALAWFGYRFIVRKVSGAMKKGKL